jgi:hypothetical protein
VEEGRCWAHWLVRGVQRLSFCSTSASSGRISSYVSGIHRSRLRRCELTKGRDDDKSGGQTGYIEQGTESLWCCPAAIRRASWSLLRGEVQNPRSRCRALAGGDLAFLFHHIFPSNIVIFGIIIHFATAQKFRKLWQNRVTQR